MLLFTTTIIYYIVLNAQQKILLVYIFYDKYILRPSNLMILMHHNDYEDAYWWNNISSEIECKGEIECYDKINEFHPKYPIIIYNHVRRYKQRLKKIVSTIKINH